MYLSHDKNAFQCKIHNSLCNSVCSEALCPKSGFLCQECAKLDIHKHHFKKICTLQQLIDSLLANLKGDNLHSYIQEIQIVQKTFWDLISFFIEHNVPSLFSLETILVQTKELFWNRILFYSTSDFSHKIRELNQKGEQDKTQGLVSLLNSYHLNAAQILANDIKAYFDTNLLYVIEEFKNLLRPYQGFVQNLSTKDLLQNLSQAWRIKDSIKLSYGILDPRSYNHLLADLQDQQHIVYFDWKSIYFYDYEIQKVIFTITTQDPINGVVYLKDKFQIVSMHNGGMLQSCGLNVWDIKTGENTLSAENNRNIYNLLYLKKQNMLIYDSDDAYGNNYHIQVFDFRVNKPVKTLCIPFLKIADELSFKYYENRNTFTIQIILDRTNSLSELYDCIFQTYECLHFRKIHSFELKVHDELQNTKTLPKPFKEPENIFITKCNHHLVFYDPGSRIPIQIFQPDSRHEEIFELGGIVCSPKKDYLLIGCKRNQGFQTVNSILIYDLHKKKVVAETENIFNALNMGLVILEKGELIIAANYDSTLQFLRKNFWTK